MSFDDRSLRKDDSPKTRCLKMSPGATCTRAGSLGFKVDDSSGKRIGTGRSAWDAWRDAESFLGLAAPVRMGNQFADYRCGCTVIEDDRSKLLTYCGKHGEPRRQVITLNQPAPCGRVG